MTTTSPWDRREDESAPAYEAFQNYRDMGGDRSTAKVAQQLGKSKTLMDRWSSKHDWVERVRLWDSEQDRIARAEQLDVVKDMAEKHARIAGAFLNKVVERLQSLDAKELTPAQMERWLDVAVKIERLSRGTSSEVVEQRHTGADGGPVEVVTAEASLDELASVMEALQQAGKLSAVPAVETVDVEALGEGPDDEAVLADS